MIYYYVNFNLLYSLIGLRCENEGDIAYYLCRFIEYPTPQLFWDMAIFVFLRLKWSIWVPLTSNLVKEMLYSSSWQLYMFGNLKFKKNIWIAAYHEIFFTKPRGFWQLLPRRLFGLYGEIILCKSLTEEVGNQQDFADVILCKKSLSGEIFFTVQQL